ncbi:MAG TPA: hypothetical protein VMD25_02840 [Acidobacteriaceae bacterium]|nr:hypothetical protein [Acidobacteriaceae bacterium]
MKFVVRAFVLSLFAAGASAAVISAHSSNVPMIGSHQAVVAAMPTPGCGPNGNCNGTGTSSGASSLVAAMPTPGCGPNGNCNGTGTSSGASSVVAAMPTPGCGPNGTCNGQNGAPPPSGL